MKNFESLFAAYLIVWAIFFVYQLSLGQRLGRLKQEIERLKRLLERK